MNINHAIHENEIGHNLPQHRFVTDNSGSICVDQLLSFENIADGFAALTQARSWDVTLDHAHLTAAPKKYDFRSYYDPQTIEIIDKIYSEDIKRFGYSKDDTFGS